MTKLQKLGSVILGAPFILSFSKTALAVNGRPVPNVRVGTGQDLVNVLTRLIDWAFVFFFVVAIFFFLWAAFDYLNSQGDPEKINKAREKLIYAVIAVVLAVVAKSLPFVIGNIVGTGAPGAL